ncbi:Monothiol glutaredoxin-S11 [Hondaea fermentalgiana]|uniref:Monothiol glutaredoxin-S11 n=1 Tax=Hondaea fermentalgiana TaxID=2315210 RepID=A0A2R5GFG5_9STRA|nr:Monothiol glutaredoxin-S11 [Hondaea fermentalgiana]|eukprot:GBG27373.1 Monothiol glutaredoxin-S11 [Hondaea fermentalgiana]
MQHATRALRMAATRSAGRLACAEARGGSSSSVLRMGALRAATIQTPVMGARAFSGRLSGEDSHSDFAPESKVEIESVEEFIQTAVKEHPVLLFMKGKPTAPQCGFSAQTVGVLQAEGIDFASADVLSSAEVREGIKKFSSWPTIPQLYVGGEFVGGCDIVTEMHKSGELKDLLAPYKAEQDANDEK